MKIADEPPCDLLLIPEVYDGDTVGAVRVQSAHLGAWNNAILYTWYTRPRRSCAHPPPPREGANPTP